MCNGNLDLIKIYLGSKYCNKKRLIRAMLTNSRLKPRELLVGLRVNCKK